MVVMLEACGYNMLLENEINDSASGRHHADLETGTFLLWRRDYQAM
jgi:hypothetical protein